MGPSDAGGDTLEALMSGTLVCPLVTDSIQCRTRI